MLAPTHTGVNSSLQLEFVACLVDDGGHVQRERERKLVRHLDPVHLLRGQRSSSRVHVLECAEVCPTQRHRRQHDDRRQQAGRASVAQCVQHSLHGCRTRACTPPPPHLTRPHLEVKHKALQREAEDGRQLAQLQLARGGDLPAVGGVSAGHDWAARLAIRAPPGNSCGRCSCWPPSGTRTHAGQASGRPCRGTRQGLLPWCDVPVLESKTVTALSPWPGSARRSTHCRHPSTRGSAGC